MYLFTDDELPLNLSTKSRHHSIWSPGSLCEQERSRSPIINNNLTTVPEKCLNNSINFSLKNDENSQQQRHHIQHEDSQWNFVRQKNVWDSELDIKSSMKISPSVGSNGERTFQVCA